MCDSTILHTSSLTTLSGPARPTVAVVQWRNELAAHTDGVKVVVWHGAARKTNHKELEKFDVVSSLSRPPQLYPDFLSMQVITTYAVLESCFRKQQQGFKRQGNIIKEKSPLHTINWNRIVVRSSCTVPPSKSYPILHSLMRPTTSRNAPPIPRRPRSPFRVNISGVCLAHLCKIEWENYTVLSASWEAIHSRIISVSFSFRGS